MASTNGVEVGIETGSWPWSRQRQCTGSAALWLVDTACRWRSCYSAYRKLTRSRFARELSNLGASIHTAALNFRPRRQTLCTSLIRPAGQPLAFVPRSELNTIPGRRGWDCHPLTPSGRVSVRKDGATQWGRGRPPSIFDPRHPPSRRAQISSAWPMLRQPTLTPLSRGKSYTLCMHASGGRDGRLSEKPGPDVDSDSRMTTSQSSDNRASEEWECGLVFRV